jgi:tetratricopeptide (TPR) repeat protein
MRSCIIILSFLIPVLTGCRDNQPGGDEAEQTPIVESTDKLLGKIGKDELMKPAFSEWFQPAYEEYEVNTELTDSYKDQLKDYEIEVFMGTWCEDSQREVPTLFKVLEAAGYPMEQLKIIAIDDEIANYKRSPDGEEEGRNIHHVPTIILKKDGKEVNRIIEYPVRTIEEDLQVIMDGNYTPYYFAADMVHEKLNEMGLETFKENLGALATEFSGKTRDVYELNTYAKTIFRQGKKEEAIQVATLNTKIYPDDANSFAGLGSRLSEMERNEEALKIFEKAVELAPDDSEFRGLLDEVKAKL